MNPMQKKKQKRKLDPKLKQAVTAAYKLGLMDGEEITKRKLKAVYMEIAKHGS